MDAQAPGPGSGPGSGGKLGPFAGALAVWLASQILGWSGYVQGADQSEATLTAIRYLTALGPAVFIALGVWFAIGYPLTRERHQQILADIDARDARP